MRFKTILLAGTFAALGVSPAIAQVTPEAGAEGKVDSGNEDIIVTAQRRDESLSRTPVAVTVLSAEALQQAQVNSEQDLRLAAPGLSVRSSLSSNQLNYSLRGQSQDAFSGTRPGVLPYINEVQIGGAGGSTAFYDLQSIQVLKGPQGTLFGRSATGGAVLFTTARPTSEFSGYVSGLIGNYEARKIEAAISGPIIPGSLTARLAGFYQERDGFQKNLFDGGREGDFDRFGIRGSLSATVGAVQNDLVVDYFEADGENTVGVLSGLLPFTGGGPGNPPFIPIQFLYAGIATPVARLTGIGTVQAFTGAPNSAAAGFYDAYFADTRRTSTGIVGHLAQQQARGPFVINSDARNLYVAENVVVTNRTTLSLGTDTELRNIIGYTDLKSSNAFDADGSPFSISSQGPKNSTLASKDDITQFSEELQIVGKAFGGRLDYVTGVYYSDEETDHAQGARFFDILFGGPLQNNDYVISNETFAGYVQGTYDLNERGLGVTAGLRYTSEKVRKELSPTDTIRTALGDPAPPGFSYDQSKTFKRLSWTFGIQNQIDADLLLYAVTRRAHKSGGFNGSVAPQVGSAATAGDSFSAEQVTDVEVGAKYRGRLGSAPTRLSLALFHNWIENSQRTAYTLVLNNPASLTVNVPKGRTYGLELEGQVQPSDWLSIGGTFNYTRARYTEGGVVANGSAQDFDQVPDTPKFSGTIFADLRVPVTGSVALLGHADVYHQTKTFTTPRSQNAAGTTIDKYTLVNLRLGLGDQDAGWSLTANLKNAFDKVYYGGGIPTGEIYQINTLVPGDPRTFTVEARFSF